MNLQDALHHARLSRRTLFKQGLTGLAALAAFDSEWAFAQSEAVTVTATPSLTIGPYFVDERLNRSDIRTDPSNNSIQAGLPLVLGITVSKITNGVITPVSGAFVDVWHCNASGIYSDVSANSTVGQKWLRGYQVTSAHGQTKFLTIYPGWYSGRTVHIHYRIRTSSLDSPVFSYTSQVFFNESVTNSVYAEAPYSSRPNRDTLNATDNIYQSGGTTVLLRLAKDSSYCMSSFHCMLTGI